MVEQKKQYGLCEAIDYLTSELDDETTLGIRKCKQRQGYIIKVITPGINPRGFPDHVQQEFFVTALAMEQANYNVVKLTLHNVVVSTKLTLNHGGKQDNEKPNNGNVSANNDAGNTS
jgi:hypothetical protein